MSEWNVGREINLGIHEVIPFFQVLFIHTIVLLLKMSASDEFQSILLHLSHTNLGHSWFVVELLGEHSFGNLRNSKVNLLGLWDSELGDMHIPIVLILEVLV